MGVYFYFYNKTKKASPKVNTFSAKLDSIADEYAIKDFEETIKSNGWDMTDVIMAFPDNFRGEIMYKNGKLYYAETYIITNETTGERAYPMDDYTGLNLMEIGELREFFEYIIDEYKWNKNDAIKAEEYCEHRNMEGVIKYSNGIILYM